MNIKFKVNMDTTTTGYPKRRLEPGWIQNKKGFYAAVRGGRSTKLLLLKQSEMTINKEDSGGVHDGNNAAPSKAFVLGNANITNDGSLEDTDGAPGGRGGVGERAFGSKGFGYAARGGRGDAVWGQINAGKYGVGDEGDGFGAGVGGGELKVVMAATNKLNMDDHGGKEDVVGGKNDPPKSLNGGQINAGKYGVADMMSICSSLLAEAMKLLLFKKNEMTCKGDTFLLQRSKNQKVDNVHQHQANTNGASKCKIIKTKPFQRYRSLFCYMASIMICFAMMITQASAQAVGHIGGKQKNTLGNPFVEDVLQQEGSLPNLKEKEEDSALIGTDASNEDDGVVVAAAAKTYTLGHGMERLKNLKRAGLRGSTDLDSAATITEVKDVVKSQLDSIVNIQKHQQNGDNEGAGLALKLLAGDTDSLVELNKEMIASKDLDLPTSFDGTSLSLNDIPNDQLIQFIPLGILDELVENTQDIYELLKGIDLSPRHDDLKTKKPKGSKQDSFEFDSDASGFGPAPGGHSNFFQTPSPNMNFHQNNFFKNPSSLKKMFHHHRASMGSDFSMPKLSKFTSFHKDEIIMAKHQIRVDALGDACSSCSLDQWSCNCEKLFSCVNDMTEYDLAVLVAGGFIETNPSSEDYGNFTVSVEQLNLYNADQGVSAKLAIVKAKAVDSNIANQAICNEVLQDLFSACNPDDDTCTDPNVQSFAVTTDQVCAAVNTPKKLLFEAIGDEFDNFADKFTESPNEPLSYDACAEYVTELDHLYEGRDTAKYPLNNPMLLNPSSSVYDESDNKIIFDSVHFPIRYNFLQNTTTGVVTREFGTVDPDPSQPKYFYLLNQASGQVLGIKDGSCNPGTPIEVQDRDIHETHYLVCGRGEDPAYCNGVMTQTAADSEEHNVRCCSDTDLAPDSDTHWKQCPGDPTRAVWGESDIISGSGETCPDTETFADAEALCISAGARLCTKDELLAGCVSGTGCVFDQELIWSSDSDTDSGFQQWLLKDDGSLESKGCTGKFLTNQWGGLCRHGNELVIDGSMTNDFDLQQWTFHKDGSVENKRCGQWNGNLAISEIEDDSITNIDYTDTIPIQFNNPETNVAMGLESGLSCINERSLTSQTRNGGDDQTFYIKRHAEGSNWEIHSKACPGMMLEISGGVCDRVPIILTSEIRDDKRNQWKITNEKIESALCEGMVMEIGLFLDRFTLKAAVTSYINEGCADDPNCTIGQTLGWPMNVWNVGYVTDFSFLFNIYDTDMTTFNENIASWDTSKATNMNSMFAAAHAFNQPLDDWNVARVTNMGGMFASAYAFNQPLNSWNVAQVTNMDYMFLHAHVFNQPLNSWDVAQVTDMTLMFNDATAFNQKLCNFKTHYHHTNTYEFMFEESGCDNKNDPTGTSQLWCQDCSYFAVEGYTSYETGGCEDMNELGDTDGGTVQACADNCSADSTCISFEYSKDGTRCMRSTTCTYDLTVKDPTDAYRFYLKITQTNTDTEKMNVLAPNNDGGWNQIWFTQTNTDTETMIFLAPNNDGGWNQNWSTKTNAVRLLTREEDPSQQWEADFTSHNYDFALLPGFPGSYTGVVIEQDTVHKPDEPGMFYVFDNEAWDAYFGSGVSVRMDFDGKQCRNGTAVYTGKISAFPPTSDHGYLGRRGPDQWVSGSANTGDWQTGDFIVKSSDECPSNGISLTSTADKELATSAMHHCDKSMSLLVGSTTSVGTLRAVATLVNDIGPDRMPGECCMDVATNSEFFGYRYDPKYEDSAGNKMECVHRGPFHLGISEEACENAGGEWYRSPCVTLQECIDDRPPRFELDAPQADSCQDNLNQLNVAYVSASTSHDDFAYDSDGNGCFKFCQSLPDYPLQIGMEVEGTNDIADTCTCLYNNGRVPSKELLPEYATPSLPKFTLKDPTGKFALGLSSKSDCTTDAISVEVQKLKAGNTRQQFQLTNDGRIVSVACPEKVITAGQDGQCDIGTSLKAVDPYFTSPTPFPTSSPTLSPPPFPDKATLKDAVTSYIDEGCADDPSCDIGQTWGWPMNLWNVGEITDFSEMFNGKSTLNENIASWDTSKATNMYQMFVNAGAFNQPLNNWDVAKVTNMTSMFAGALVFNQPLDYWNVARVTNMQSMFTSSNAFNQPLNSWNVAEVGNMGYMFMTAKAFNQNLCNFGTYYDSVNTYDYMFVDSGCDNKNDPTSATGPSWCQDCAPTPFPTSSPTIPPTKSPTTSQPTKSPTTSSPTTSSPTTSSPTTSSPTTSSPTTPQPTSSLASLDVEGYTRYDTGGCAGMNELGTTRGGTVQACADICNDEPTCISFEYSKDGYYETNTCMCSTTCTYDLTVKDANDPYRFYLKLDVEGYTRYDTGGCVGRNELGSTNGGTVQACADSCNADPTCISFEYSKEGTACVRSTTCTYDLTVKDANDPYRFYLKSPTRFVSSKLYDLSTVQQWTYDSTDGGIFNVGCPSLQLSAIKDDSSLTSDYFALENPKSHFSIGAVGTLCQDGMAVELQKTVYGSPNQQFYLDNDNKIVSAMCPDLVVGASNCDSSVELQLLSQGHTWQFHHDDDYQTIESLNCPGMFIAIGNGQSNSTRATNYRRFLSAAPLSAQFANETVQLPTEPSLPENATNEAASNTVILPPRAGESIILSNNSAEQYQLWTQKHERFQNLKGPFSIVNPSSGLAIHVEDKSCSHGMGLEIQNDDYSSSSQQFYLGQYGSIISVKCPGLVISIDDLADSCSNMAGQSLKLKTYQIGEEGTVEKGMKWKWNGDGTIESVKCQGVVIDMEGNVGSNLILQNRDSNDSSQTLSLHNARLLDSSDALTDNWIQSWTVSFDEPDYTAADLPESSGSDGNVMCYPLNQGFSSSFDDFASNFVIENAADEDQCEQAREEMGFESDYPFDTEVCQKFMEHMCDQFFTGIDHMTETLTEPPKFEEVEYEEEEYEEVVYEAPDYAEDPPLPALELNEFPSSEPVDTTSKEGLVTLENEVLKIEGTRDFYEVNKAILINAFGYVCETMPDDFGADTACWIGLLQTALHMDVLSWALEIAFRTAHNSLENEAMSSNEAYYGYFFSEATYNNLDAYSQWNKDSLTQIAATMNDQHTSMRQHLQDRHYAMETNIGQDIFDAQNALGQGIVDAQNANGQGIADARNSISDQHNQMLGWLYPTLCTIYEQVGGDPCTQSIGPLKEHQEHIPLELNWPEGQPTLMERLEQIESKFDKALVNNDVKRIKEGGADLAKLFSPRNLLVAGTDDKATELLKEQGNEMKSKMKGMEDNMAEMGEKVDAIEASVKEMKEMMSQMMKMVG